MTKREHEALTAAMFHFGGARIAELAGVVRSAVYLTMVDDNADSVIKDLIINACEELLKEVKSNGKTGD